MGPSSRLLLWEPSEEVGVNVLWKVQNPGHPGFTGLIRVGDYRKFTVTTHLRPAVPWDLIPAEKEQNCSIYLQGNNPAGSLDFESPLLGVGLAVKDCTGEVDTVQGICILRGPRIIQVAFPLVVEEPAGFPAPDGPFAAKLT